jgi:hypothetical protein
MVKSSIFTTHSGLKKLAILTALQLPFLGSMSLQRLKGKRKSGMQ